MQEFEIEFEIKPTEFEIDISNVIRELTPPLINLEVDPTNEKQVFNHEGEYGYDEVTVNPISKEYVKVNGTLDINSNGEYDVKNYEKANVNVGGINKGLIINSCDSDGYVTNAEIVGMTEIPNYYLARACYKGSTGIDFGWMSRIESNLHLPNNITKIGRYAFDNCTLLALTQLPSELRELGIYSFNMCSELLLTDLPEKLITIGQACFYDCKKITIKEIPEGVTQISNQCFYQCTGLTELTIKGDITEIATYSFYGCSNLSKLVLPNITEVPTLSNITAFNSTPIKNGRGYIYVPDDLVASFQSATNWSTYASQIKPISELEG